MLLFSNNFFLFFVPLQAMLYFYLELFRHMHALVHLLIFVPFHIFGLNSHLIQRIFYSISVFFKRFIKRIFCYVFLFCTFRSSIVKNFLNRLFLFWGQILRKSRNIKETNRDNNLHWIHVLQLQQHLFLGLSETLHHYYNDHGNLQKSMPGLDLQCSPRTS